MLLNIKEDYFLLYKSVIRINEIPNLYNYNLLGKYVIVHIGCKLGDI